MQVTITLASESRGKKRGKKQKKGRGLMLSGFMKIVSTELGEQLTRAVESGDGDAIQSTMIKIGSKMRERFAKKDE